ncbi:hypothetical protein [Laribacter hongkongensis]|uniref:hypothetical protein n=1 Tax=Laribacter hongkongensis TaxID=168471 RepID=UPI001EFDD94C|nr:hypothetical protein [Laribacter hongkongensis]MCG9097971.1 hypothetical protein [Laribacter hongkongensis]MCG9124819.1 hypothetical protein [Laribacter hongkongensis]
MAGPFPVPGTPFKLGADIQLKLKKPPEKKLKNSGRLFNPPLNQMEKLAGMTPTKKAAK